MSTDSFTRGVNRQIGINRQTAVGTLAAAAGAKVLRRMSANPNLMRDVISSQEILPSHQVRDARLGTKRVPMQFNGQLSPGAYPDFFEGMVRRNFSAGAAATAAALGTVTAAAGPPGTFTRSTGSWITDGFRVGDIVRFTGFAAGLVGNNDRNYRITALTATVLTTSGTANEVVVAGAGGAAAVAAAVVGKKTFIPQTGHLFHAYTIEDWIPDASPSISERYWDMRMQALAVRVPPSGIVTLDAQMIGRDRTRAATRYFTTPTAPTADNSLSSVSGRVRFNGADIASITGLAFQLACPTDAQPCVGTQLVPDNFQGTLSLRGQGSCYLTDGDFATLFENETELDLHLMLTSDSTNNSPFVAFTMNRVKLFGMDRQDSDRSLMQSFQFQALEHVGAAASFEATTFSVQDSAA
jgi:hypothetical protein